MYSSIIDRFTNHIVLYINSQDYNLAYHNSQNIRHIKPVSPRHFILFIEMVVPRQEHERSCLL